MRESPRSRTKAKAAGTLVVWLASHPAPAPVGGSGAVGCGRIEVISKCVHESPDPRRKKNQVYQRFEWLEPHKNFFAVCKKMWSFFTSPSVRPRVSSVEKKITSPAAHPHSSLPPLHH